ncbi:acyltransferase [Simiduia sp. 21SJ11W-1]|uniref:acyltransferase family protein n=1 Tax=Simiduia sp. 21SJ11W-1 TaxID=2909669 RepID=UPI00209DDF1F|nr:acyltransferase [Simiduia sp. 21SJ11W-1]UTA48886.1 acyltransferase [Simiduia sp. 21SJ11W-1]
MFSGVGRYFDVIGKSGHFPALDGLRAIAIILVLLRHAIHFYPDAPQGFFFNLWVNGWLGVDLFFVLSGFLISYHLLNSWPKAGVAGYVGSFYLKRVLRILPLYLFIVGVVWLGVVPYYQVSVERDPASLWVYIFFVQEFFNSELLVTLWSVGVEEKFYLVAPLLVYGGLVAVNCRRYILLLISFILSIYFLKWLMMGGVIGYEDYFWFYRAPFWYAVCPILMGLVVGLVKHKYPVFEPPSNLKLLMLCAFPALVFLLFFSAWVYAGNWYLVDFVQLLFSVLCAVVVAICVWLQEAGRGILAGRFLRLMAKLSYAVYLVHLLMIPLSIELSEFVGGEFWVFFVIYISLTMFVSFVLHLVVEKPFLELKKYVR